MTPAHLDPHAVILTPRQIAIRAAKEACTVHGVSWQEIVSPSRRRGPLIEARIQIASHLRANGLSMTQIGRIMGGRDHTSILYYLGRAGEKTR